MGHVKTGKALEGCKSKAKNKGDPEAAHNHVNVDNYAMDMVELKDEVKRLQVDVTKMSGLKPTGRLPKSKSDNTMAKLQTTHKAKDD